MNIDICFEAISKNCDDVTIEGFTTLEDLDNDERPFDRGEYILKIN